jgi:two-component system, cell cycle sensor histidine kinase and response regulator CckA
MSPEPNCPPRPGLATVLLVEDDHALRALVHELLELRGYTVLQAADGEAALAVARAYEGRIDVLVTDLNLPRLAGRALVAELVARDRHLRVLSMSGSDGDGTPYPQVARREAFLPKPFTPDALTGAVEQLLES